LGRELVALRGINRTARGRDKRPICGGESAGARCDEQDQEEDNNLFKTNKPFETHFILLIICAVVI
jgi:hypothetical protein